MRPWSLLLVALLSACTLEFESAGVTVLLPTGTVAWTHCPGEDPRVLPPHEVRELGDWACRADAEGIMCWSVDDEVEILTPSDCPDCTTVLVGECRVQVSCQ